MNADKECFCCGAIYTPSDWDALPLVGSQPTTDDNNKPLVLELRNCGCRSTLAIERPVEVACA